MRKYSKKVLSRAEISGNNQSCGGVMLISFLQPFTGEQGRNVSL